MNNDAKSFHQRYPSQEIHLRQNWFFLVFLVFNIFYLSFVWLWPDIYGCLLQSGLMPLTKLWLINLVGFLVLGSFRFICNPNYFISLVLCAHIIAVVGFASGKDWARRILGYILISMCVWGILWPNISSRGTEVMQTYMRRGYNALVYNQYWQPMKLRDCKDCKPVENAQQYEHLLSPQPLPDRYAQVEALLMDKFSSQPRASSLAPTYWGLFRMAEDAFKATQELYEVAFFFAKLLFYFWFVMVPLTLLYVLKKKKHCQSMEINA